MAKIDKSNFSKEQWYKIREERRREKQIKRLQEESSIAKQTPIASTRHPIPSRDVNKDLCFVLGNGTSRSAINPEDIKPYGKIYGCNALYRSFNADYLVAVDVKMILEINKSGYQHNNEVWTNPNKSYQNIKNLNIFHPSKGWSSGPTALWLASQHSYNKIFILGFDYKGLEDGKLLNNLYANTKNYKKSHEGATFFGNWLRQTISVVKENPNTTYYRVIASDNYIPEELNKFNNLKHIFVEDFQKMFSLS